jgi:hypothetical protein
MLDEFHSPLFFIGRLGLAMPVESTIDQRAILDAGLLKNNGVYVGAWRDKNNKIHYLRHAGLSTSCVTHRPEAARGSASLSRCCFPGAKAMKIRSESSPQNWRPEGGLILGAAKRRISLCISGL